LQYCNNCPPAKRDRSGVADLRPAMRPKYFARCVNWCYPAIDKPARDQYPNQVPATSYNFFINFV